MKETQQFGLRYYTLKSKEDYKRARATWRSSIMMNECFELWLNEDNINFEVGA